MSKLWSVRVMTEFVMPVYAEDKKTAEEVALENADEEHQNLPRDWYASTPIEIKAIQQLDQDFIGSIPWGGDGDRTCEAILADKEVVK